MCLGSRKNNKVSELNSSVPITLNFTYWNIEGFKSKILGNKFTDPDFLSEIHNADVIGISETHLHTEVIDELNIPGFVPINFKNRPKNTKSNISSGGVAILVKEYLKTLIQPIYTENQDIVWIKLSKQCWNISNDIYLGTIYFSPLKGEISKCEKISTLTDEIISFNRKGGDIILQGDFNARTSNKGDCVKSDKFDPVDMVLETDQIHINPRNSKDKKLDGRGRELLDLCKSLDLNILNGRKTGDIFGDFTSFQWKGNGLVDYVITSKTLFSSVLSLKVGHFMPWLSDHCALHYNFQTENTHKSILNKTDLHPKPNMFYWDSESTEKFIQRLKSDEVAHKLKTILNTNDANDMLTDINEILKSTAKKCKIKVVKQGQYKHSSSNPWFDKECLNIKLGIGRQAKLLKKDPQNIRIKETLYRLKKKYKNILKKNKKKYYLGIINQLNCTKNNTKMFWKLLEKLSSNKKDGNSSTSGVSANRWLNHFKNIFSNEKTFSYPTNPSKIGPLDFTITKEEINEAAYILKPGKSPGFDNIPNEMVLSLLQTHPEIILKLFNTILSDSTHITCWKTAIINPIYKKGSKSDPSNYRGISLLSCFNKFFTAILNKRLMKFCWENNILTKEQMGFIPGNRTSDAFIVIHNIINNYCHLNSKHIYGCFVDFERAFDSVPRHKLFEKLINYNVTGKFYESIKNLYSNDLSCIKVGDNLTETFQNTQGVKQGCIMSPTLFNIFLADLPNIFKGNNNLLKINENNSLSCVIWADDLLLLSETENGLNAMLEKLHSYSQENLIKVNIEKTKCMIFNKTGRHVRKLFIFGKNKIETIREYKYLGLLITPSFNLSSILGNLKDRASRSYNLLKIRLGEYFRKDINTTVYLFDMLVKPILLYGSDYWGCLKFPRNNPIENLYIKFCKDLLGVQKQTTNAGVLLELGKWPLSIHARKNCIKNWERIAVHKKANILTQSSYQWALQNGAGWAIKVKEYLSQIGLMGVFLNNESQKSANLQVIYREKDIFHQTEFHKMQQDTAKLRTFSKIKTEIGIEKYLTNVHNITDRISLSKLRLSNHRLMIEVGRHKKIQRQNRICPFCPSNIEDEIHFITTCPVYYTIRNALFAELPIDCPILNADKCSLFEYLMKDQNIIRHTAKFITNANLIREFLLSNHRNEM